MRKARTDPKLRKGETVSRDNGRVLTAAWQDNRTVRFLSTKHDMSMATLRRRVRGGGFEEVEKPVAVADYNRWMGGVDHVDQMINYYPGKIRFSIRGSGKGAKKVPKSGPGPT